jgi:methylmalonyl-CoA mutase
MNTKPDFTEFQTSTWEDWKAQVLKELKDKPLESLNWTDENGISSKPYYTEAASSSVLLPAKPAGWEIHQEIDAPSLTDANRMALSALAGGASSIGFLYYPSNSGELNLLLDNIFIDIIGVHFKNEKAGLQLAQHYLTLARSKGKLTKALKGSISFNVFSNPSTIVDLIPLAQLAKENFSLFKVLTIDAASIHQQGGSAVQELAYALACAQEYLHQLTEAGFSADDVSAMIQFNLGCGPSYFTEIAKFRAMRRLWSTLVKEYNPQHDCTRYCTLYAETSLYYQTIPGEYNNLLRATTSAMSAVIGGANFVHVYPHDTVFRSPGETSMRYARNIQHLLADESYLNTLTDAGSGSYYIEDITAQMMKSVWDIFLEIEKRGGIMEAADFFRNEVEKNALKKTSEVAEGRRTVLGVNKYPLKDESIIIEKAYNKPRIATDIEAKQIVKQ